MHYLITGGTGLIGQALICKLLARKSTVTVLTRNIHKAEKLFSTTVALIDELSIDHIEHCDVVINLAGEAIADKRWTIKQKNEISQSRWQITALIAELIKQAKNPPSLFISGSAVGFYGRQNNQVIDETFTQVHKEFTYDVCQQWEKIDTQAQSAKTRVALLRTGIVLARVSDGGALAKMYLPFKLGLGGKVSTGEQMMSWIHIEDMVNAILFIIENSYLNGAINMTAPNPVSNDLFSKALAKQLNRPCIFTTPAWLFKFLLGEMSDLLIYGQNVVPAKLLSVGFVFKHKTVNEALENLVIPI